MRILTVILIVLLTFGIAMGDPYESPKVPTQTWVDSNDAQRIEMVRDANINILESLMQLNQRMAQLSYQIAALGQQVDQLQKWVNYQELLESHRMAENGQ